MSPALDPKSAPPVEVGSAQAGRDAPAVRRAGAILWHLANFPRGLPLSAIARELEVLPSTCLRILRELVGVRLIAYDANTKLYRLGSGILTLAREITKQNSFVQVAQPLLDRLSREYHVGASAQERDDDELVIVGAVASLPGDMFMQGGRLPLFTSASGRLMAALGDFADAELRAGFLQARWQERPDVETWLKEVRTARRVGYAFDEGQYRKGITAIAARVECEDEGAIERTVSLTTITA